MWLRSTLHFFFVYDLKDGGAQMYTCTPLKKKVTTSSKIGSAHVLRLENILNTFDENVDEVQDGMVKMTRVVT